MGVIKEEKNKLTKNESSTNGVYTGKFEEKLLTLTSSSTVSVSSSGNRDMTRSKGSQHILSRGELLRQLGECNRNSIAVNDTGDGKAGEINGAAFVPRISPWS